MMAGCFPGGSVCERLIPLQQEKQSMDKAENPSTVLVTIDIDIGKDVFHVVGFGADGKIVFRRKI